MIYVYTNKKDSADWIMQNDLFFNLYTGNEVFTEEDAEIIWQIDQAKVMPDKRIETKYGLGTIRNLSTGCKTILNVKKNPGKVVNSDECGANVLDILFAMDDIRLYMSRPERINIEDHKTICFNGKEIVTGRRGYEHWWTKEYERRSLDDLQNDTV